MRYDGTRIVFIIESVYEEGVIADAILYRLWYLVKYLLCRIHENFIQVLLLADLIKEHIHWLDPE